MKTKKNLLCLTASLALLLAGCQSNSSSNQESSSEPVTSSSEVSSSIEESSSEENVAEIGTALSDTPYQSAELGSEAKFGLSNPSIVGVDSSDNSLVSNIKNDSEYTKVIEVKNITLENIKDVIPTATEKNDFYALYTAIAQAKANCSETNTVKVKLPSGTMTIDGGLVTESRVMVLKELQNVDFVGEDTVINIVYKDLNWKGFIELNKCKNITVKGISVDTEIPSTLTGQIVSMDLTNKTSTIKVDPSYNNLVEELQKKPTQALMEYLEFDVNTKTPLIGGNFIDRGTFNGYTITGNATDGYQITVQFINPISRSRNNSYVNLSFSEYDVASVNIYESENVILEDVNIYHAPGMGIVAQRTKGLLLNRVNLKLKEGSQDLMTATADGLHFNSVHGVVSITNSIIENTHDDALNIKHGYWYTVVNADNTNKLLSINKLTGEIETPSVGDKVMVYNEDTFVGHNPNQGYYTIKAVEKTTTGFNLTVNERMSGVNDWGNCRATVLNDAPQFTFKNNIVRNKRNRGILVQVPDATIENNTFQNVGHGSIQAGSAMDVYNECSIPNNMTIKNNKFIGNIFLPPEPLYGDVSVFAISNNSSVAPKNTLKNFNISNNFFTSNGNAAICLRGVGNSTIDHNFFYECCKYQVSGEQTNCLLNSYNSGPITMSNNYSYYTRDLGMSGIYLQGLSTEDDIALTNNTNIDFYRSSEVGPDVDITKATGSITFDGNLSEWANIGATNIEFIGASQATGDEVSIDSVKDHFEIKKGYITHTDTGIALGFEVFDLVRDVKPAANFWTGDCIEILATTLLTMPGADTQVYKEDGGVVQVAFAPTWTASNYSAITTVRSNSKYVGKEKSLTIGMSSTDTGYTCEILLPYSVFPEFKTAIDAGNRIGMAIVVADSERDDLGIKRVQIGNVPHFVENYKTKSEMMPRYLFK